MKNCADSAGIDHYEGDYWCLTYKEGSEWLLRRYEGARCPEKIRVAGHSVLQQIEIYLQETDEGRRLFTPVVVGDPAFHQACGRHAVDQAARAARLGAQPVAELPHRERLTLREEDDRLRLHDGDAERPQRRGEAPVDLTAGPLDGERELEHRIHVLQGTGHA